MKNIWFRIIAVLEMVGGGVGIIFMLYMGAASGFDLNVLVVLPILLAVFALSLVAGILLWRGRESGRKASIVVQLIQLLKIVSPAFAFMFSFGFDLFPHITFVKNFSTVGIQFRFLADGQLFINSEGAPILLGISIPAVIALAKLWNYDPELEKEDSLAEENNPPGPDEYFRPKDPFDPE